MAKFKSPANFPFDKPAEWLDCSLNGKTQAGNNDNKASQKTENGGEMTRDVENVGKHSITEMKSALQRKLHAITVIKWDTGLEYVAATDQ